MSTGAKGHGPLPALLGILPTVLLLFGLTAAAAHEHADGPGSRGCAICTLGQTPGTTPVAVVAGTPAPHVEPVTTAPVLAPAWCASPAPSSRAPPSA